MLSLIVAALLAAPAAAQRTDIQPFSNAKPAPTRCNPAAEAVSSAKRTPHPRHLADEPPASQFYTVYTVLGGCPKPAVVRKGIGNTQPEAVPVLTSPPRATNAK